MFKGRLLKWVLHMTSEGSKQVKRIKMGTLSTFWWNIWKKRNHRVFDSKELSIPQLPRLLHDDLDFFARALAL
jgi:hypothetical protein